jgi:hypothetical protein
MQHWPQVNPAFSRVLSEMRRLQTDRKSQPIQCPRASTGCPKEFGRASTFFLIAAYRTARVRGLACKRKCPRIHFCPGTAKDKFAVEKCFGRIRWQKRLGINDRLRGLLTHIQAMESAGG